MNPVDSEAYFTQVVATLSTYPPEVVSMVSHPIGGLVTKCKWLPSVAEVAVECEKLTRIARMKVDIADAEAKQIAERDRQ